MSKIPALWPSVAILTALLATGLTARGKGGPDPYDPELQKPPPGEAAPLPIVPGTPRSAPPPAPPTVPRAPLRRAAPAAPTGSRGIPQAPPSLRRPSPTPPPAARKSPTRGVPKAPAALRRTPATPAARTKMPLVMPAPAAAQRPWWDWMGVTQSKPAPAAARSPSAAPSALRPSPSGGQQKPWWDWLGVTQKEQTNARHLRPTTSGTGKPAARDSRTPSMKAPARQPLPQMQVKADKPWWDLMGVTQQSKPNVLRLGQHVKPERPAWDLLGVTEPQNPRHTTRRSRQSERPWWDWAGVTDPPKPGRGVYQPRTRMGPRPKADERPWWDWAGVTESKPASRRR